MFGLLLAQGTPDPNGQMGFGNPMFLMVMMLLFMLVIWLPASRRQKREQAQMLASIKRNAKVVTSGGIIGTVVTAKDGDDELVIRTEDSRLKVLRSSIVRVLAAGDDEPKA
jgi:preprotein translocase subunit YajC